jgi:hypothetical protein
LLLEPETVIGRAATCSWRLRNPRASSLQAVARWTGQRWELNDRSRNGTFVNGTRMRQAPHVLVAGDSIGFAGGSEQWDVVDVSAPTLMVVALDGSEQIVAEDGIIGIPAGDTPAWTIYRASDGRFKLESPDSDLVILENACILRAADKDWRFCSPEGMPATLTTELSGPVVVPVLHFLVSSDEEYVELQVEY